MKITLPDAAPRGQWTLVRRARQLLTLRGPSGPRRGAALNELSIINDGALLIRNGVIEEAGTSRRVENLAQARKAREIDVAGRIVMPAFVDPDAVLVFPPATGRRVAEGEKQPRIGVLSKHRLAVAGASAAAEWVRSGVLSTGAHTGCAAELRDTVRILRIHQALQAKPLRIRSIFSPRALTGAHKGGEALLTKLNEKWLPSIRQRKLASIFEIAEEENGLAVEQLHRAAVAATSLGFAIRIRSNRKANSPLLELALGAGAVALIGPPDEPGEGLRIMATMGCIHVLPLTSALRNKDWGADLVRREIDTGIPIALASGFCFSGGPTSLNSQFLLYLAVEHWAMTPEEAITAATYNAACSLRMSHVTGSLEPGKAADLIVMDVPDYRDLFHRAGHNDVQLVMRSGYTVYRRAALMVD